MCFSTLYTISLLSRLYTKKTFTLCEMQKINVKSGSSVQLLCPHVFDCSFPVFDYPPKLIFAKVQLMSFVNRIISLAVNSIF